MNKKFLWPVETLRVFFTLLIVCFHMIMVYLNELFPDLYSNWAIHVKISSQSVEFFFLLSAFFFFPIKKESKWSVFVLKKLIRLWPVFAFSTVCTAIICKGTNQYSVYVLDLLTLQGSGLLLEQGLNFNAWYVSSLFWAMILYFFIIKKHEKANANFIIAIIMYCSAYRICHNLFDTYTRCLLRAFLCLGLCIFVKQLYETYERNHLSTGRKIGVLYSIAEILLICSLGTSLLSRKAATCNYFAVILQFAVLAWCFVMSKGMVSKICSKNLLNFIWKYMYSVYIMQNLSFIVCMKCFWSHKDFVKAYPIIVIIIGIAVCMLLGVLTYYLVERPSINFFQNRINNRLENEAL